MFLITSILPVLIVIPSREITNPSSVPSSMQSDAGASSPMSQFDNFLGKGHVISMDYLLNDMSD